MKIISTKTVFGLALKWVLNKIDKNHVEKAAENEQ